MKNSQIAIIIAIAVLIGYTLVRLGNSSTYSSFSDAIALNGEKTTVIGYLDLEESMDFNPKTVQFAFTARDKKETLAESSTTNLSHRISSVPKKSP